MNRSENYLTCLAEECAEVTKDVAKTLRFGLYDSHPKYDNITNKDRLSQECGDIIGVMGSLLELEVLDIDLVMEYAEAKKAKLKKWFEYSVEVGTAMNSDTTTTKELLDLLDLLDACGDEFVLAENDRELLRSLLGR